MAPSATDYVHGLRRMWWLPLVALLVGVGLGLAAVGGTRANTTTSASALFTFRIGDAGQESDGSARGAEARVAQSRLAAYVQIARSSQGVEEILEGSDVEAEISTAGYPTGSFDASTGIVDVQINGDLDQTHAADLVGRLIAAIVDEVTALDAQQDTPSLRSDVLVTEPQSDVVSASRISRALLPGLVLLMLGLGVTYLMVWRQDRIHGRHGIEDGLGARVLGEMNDRPADAPAIALALRRGRKGPITALLVPVGRVGSEATSMVGPAVAAAGRDLGLDTHWSAVGLEDSHRFVVGAATHADSKDPDGPRTTSLTLLDALAVGLNAESLHAAARVDLVTLVVEYGVTSYSELSTAGRMIAELTEAEIAVIGVRRGGVRNAELWGEPPSPLENPRATAPR